MKYQRDLSTQIANKEKCINYACTVSSNKVKICLSPDYKPCIKVF